MLAPGFTLAPASRFCKMILGLWLLAVGAAAAALDTPASQATVHLIGTVLDASGQSASDADVGLPSSTNMVSAGCRPHWSAALSRSMV